MNETLTADGKKARSGIPASAVAVFLILSLGIGLVGWWYYAEQKKNQLADYGKQLGAIADLKIHEIQTWRRERLGDAQVVSRNPVLPPVFKALQAGPKPEMPGENFRVWLDSYRAASGYRDAIVFGAKGQVLFHLGTASAESLDEEDRGAVAEAFHTGQPALTDLYFSDKANLSGMDVLAPVSDPDKTGRSFGIIDFRIDPRDYLYPLVQTWPIASGSAETLLVRREGDEVLYLNELRHRKGTAGRLRFPLTNSRLPAVAAVLGRSDIMEGIDYRGVPVLAATRAVPDSPWFLVAKVDLEEIFLPIRREGRILVFLCLALIGAVHGATGYFIRRDQIRHLRKESAEQLKAEAAILKLNAELDERVRSRTAQLEEANRELEAFSYSVSHDLRAPLRIIDGFSQALLEDCGGRIGEEGKSHLDRVRSNAQFMGHLIDDMLKLARVGKIEFEAEEIDLSRLAGQSAADIARAYPDHPVDLAIAADLAVRSDSRLLRAVLDNLFDNAWKFTARTLRPRVEFGAESGEKGAVYFVRDNGIGFDMTYAGKLFGAFQRLHAREEFPGTGIGLATVQRIIRRLGGSVWAEGEEGRGAAFFFTLNEPERRIG